MNANARKTNHDITHRRILLSFSLALNPYLYSSSSFELLLFFFTCASSMKAQRCGAISGSLAHAARALKMAPFSDGRTPHRTSWTPVTSHDTRRAVDIAAAPLQSRCGGVVVRHGGGRNTKKKKKR